MIVFGLKGLNVEWHPCIDEHACVLMNECMQFISILASWVVSIIKLKLVLIKHVIINQVIFNC